MPPFELVLVAVLVFSACGARKSVAPAAATPTATAPVTTCAPAIPTVDRPHDGDWARWTHEQRLAYMKAAALPTEAPLFREYAPDRFADFTCRTCHGAGADDGTYKMPNPALPKLDVGHLFEMEKTRPRVFRFMYDVVTPRTAALLNLPEWQHETMSGFGCLRCHLPKEAAAASGAREAERLRTTAELARLRANLQPHFLFNTLSTVAGLVGEDPRAARRLIGTLGDLLRDSFVDADDSELARQRRPCAGARRLGRRDAAARRLLRAGRRHSPRSGLPRPLTSRPRDAARTNHGRTAALGGSLPTFTAWY